MSQNFSQIIFSVDIVFHITVEETITVFTGIFRIVHGNIGIFDQLAYSQSVIWEDGDTDTHGNHCCFVIQNKWMMYNIDKLAGKILEVINRIKSVLQNQELIATVSCQNIIRSDTGKHTVGYVL